LERYFKNKYAETLRGAINSHGLPSPNNKYSPQHLTYSVLKEHSKRLGIEFNDKLKIISVVRNPYSRAMSELFWKKSVDLYSCPEIVYKALQDMIKTNPDNHAIPQYNFLCVDGENLISNVIVFKKETLTIDIRKYGYTDFDIHVNVSTTINHIDYLNSDSIKLINQYYAKDFVLFGYEKLRPEDAKPAPARPKPKPKPAPAKPKPAPAKPKPAPVKPKPKLRPKPPSRR